jgi:hypothetical protein
LRREVESGFRGVFFFQLRRRRRLRDSGHGRAFLRQVDESTFLIPPSYGTGLSRLVSYATRSIIAVYS